jgi:hypothetical protein
MSLQQSRTAQQQKSVFTQMGFTPRRDPIPRTDKDLQARDHSKIEHDGGIDSQEVFCIVRKHETEGEKQSRENLEEYGYAATDAQLAIVSDCKFYDDYDYDNSIYEPLYEPETYEFYGTFSDEYISMVESGEVIDEEFSCRFPQAGTGASVDGEDLVAEETPAESPTSPEETAFLEANTTEPQGELTTAFSAAADPEPEPEALPAPAVAANNATYQAPAMSA